MDYGNRLNQIELRKLQFDISDSFGDTSGKYFRNAKILTNLYCVTNLDKKGMEGSFNGFEKGHECQKFEEKNQVI